MFDVPDTVKGIKFVRSQYAHRIVRMGNSRTPKKVLNRKFRGRRPVERPRLRWEDVRKDSLLLMKISGSRRLTEDRNIWRRSIPATYGSIGRNTVLLTCSLAEFYKHRKIHYP